MGTLWRVARFAIAIVLAAVAILFAAVGMSLIFDDEKLGAGLFAAIVGGATAAGAYGVWPPRLRIAATVSGSPASSGDTLAAPPFVGDAPHAPELSDSMQSRSYLARTLNSGERIERSARLHWIVFARPAAALVFGVLVATAEGARVFGILVAVLALIALVLAYIRWRTTEIAITNQRVLLKVGLIKRDTIEIIASKIESVDVSQSILGRIMNFGTVMVRGTGGNLNKIADVPDPLEFRRAVARV